MSVRESNGFIAIVALMLVLSTTASGMPGCELWASYQGFTDFVGNFDQMSTTTIFYYPHPAMNFPGEPMVQIHMVPPNPCVLSATQTCFVLALNPVRSPQVYNIGEAVEIDCCQVRAMNIGGVSTCTPTMTRTPTNTPTKTHTPPGGPSETPAIPTATPLTPTVTPTESPTPETTPVEVAPTDTPQPSPSPTPQLVSAVVNGPFPPVIVIRPGDLENRNPLLVAEFRMTAYNSSGIEENGSWSAAVAPLETAGGSSDTPQVELTLVSALGVGSNNPDTALVEPRGDFDTFNAGTVMIRFTFTRHDGATLQVDRALSIRKAGADSVSLMSGPPLKRAVKWMLRSR